MERIGRVNRKDAGFVIDDKLYYHKINQLNCFACKAKGIIPIDKCLYSRIRSKDDSIEALKGISLITNLPMCNGILDIWK